MGWTQPRTSRFLDCKRGVNVLDVATVLAHLDVRGADREEILELAADPYSCSWWQERGEESPTFPAVSGQEASAVAIHGFHPTLVPDLLQEPTYTRALLGAGSVVPPDHIDQHVDLLRHRQTVIARNQPPELLFVIDRHALPRTGPSREAIARQVRHLLQLSGRPHVTIRVLPDGAGLLRGYPPFELLSFAQDSPAVYVEMLNVTGFLEQPTTVATFRRALEDLENAALDERDSRKWLGTLAHMLGDPCPGPS